MTFRGTLPCALCVLGLLVVSADGARAADTGRLFVKSKPSGAQIFLDDEEEPRGKTPCILRRVPAGTHTLRGRLDGHEDASQEIEVKKGALGRASLVFATGLEDAAGTADAATGTGDGASEEDLRKALERKVTFDFVDMPLQEAIQFLQTLTKATVILDPAALKESGAVSTPISLRMEDKPLGFALKMILGLAGLDYTLKDEAIFISTPQRLAALKPTDEADATPEAGDASSDGDKPPKFIHIDCPVCDGTGLLQEAGCPGCKGTGYDGYMPCDECGGTRKIEHACPYCMGEGTLVRGGNEKDCPKCKGKGKLPCPMCRGKGKFKRANPEFSRKPSMPCPYCQGEGFESNVRCLRCSGKGTFVSGEGGGGMFTYVKIDCPFCGGDGKGPPVCRRCRGAGVLNIKKNPAPCQPCFATGRLFRPCKACRGQGWIRAR